MKTRKRLDAKARREEILTGALSLAERVGFHNIDRDGVAAAAKCSAALVSSYFGTMAALRKAVMRAAVHRENLKVIAQGLSVGDKQAIKAPPTVKQRAVNNLAGV